MAIPIIPAIGAAGAGYNLIRNMFSKKPEFKIPDYFGADYENKLAAIRQARQAQYGSGLTDISNYLADTGTLNPAALTDVATKFNIAKGADIAGAESEAYTSELDQLRQATLLKNQTMYEGDVASRDKNLALLGDLASSAASIYAAKKGKKGQDAGNKGRSLPEDQQYIQLSDGRMLANPNYKSSARRILKTLLGI